MSEAMRLLRSQRSLMTRDLGIALDFTASGQNNFRISAHSKFAAFSVLYLRLRLGAYFRRGQIHNSNLEILIL